MNDWLHNLPIFWMVAVVFALTYLVTFAIFAIVSALAVGERVKSFKAVSPGILSPLGVLFGLFVAFTAAQVWGDNERATAAVDREASALRAVTILAASFPGDTEMQLRGLVRSHIEQAAAQEWPMMAEASANLTAVPRFLAEALNVALKIAPEGQGQMTAQRELVTALQSALDARRQRIIVSHSQVNFVKWLCLVIQAVAALTAIAFVQSDNRLASAISLGLFSTGVAASILLIAAHDRPFTGALSITPAALMQVMPEASGSN
jgi:hypothetical protein